MTGAAAYLLAKNAKGGGGETPTSYNDLDDLPRINDTELKGDMSSDDLRVGSQKMSVEGETLIVQTL